MGVLASHSTPWSTVRAQATVGVETAVTRYAYVLGPLRPSSWRSCSSLVSAALARHSSQLQVTPRFVDQAAEASETLRPLRSRSPRRILLSAGYEQSSGMQERRQWQPLILQWYQCDGSGGV